MGNCLGCTSDGSSWTIEASKRSFSRRADPWEKTGMVAFRSSNLREFPKQVEPISKKVRVLDGTDNKITEVPEYVGLMAPCHRIGLSRNRLTTLPDGISALSNLRVLLLDHNRFRSVPSAIFSLPSLERLNLANNLIMELPKRVGHLKALKFLDLSGNRLVALPRELGRCVALEELRVSDNALARLPTDLAKLERLKLVVAENNMIDSVPPEVLRYCENMQTLALHGNPITLEKLEATDGYPEFEARRKSKWDKSIAAGVLLGSTRLDEAAERAGKRRSADLHSPANSEGAAQGAGSGKGTGTSKVEKSSKARSKRAGKVKSYLVDVAATQSADTS